MTFNDHFIAIAKSAAALTPIGSALVTAINEYVPSAHDFANQRAAKILFERLDAFGDRINVEFIKKDEFVELYKNCVVIVQRSQFDEKYQAAANILLNALLRDGDADKLPYDELDHFARCVESLTLASCHVLAKSIQVAKHNRNRTDFGAVHRVYQRVDIDLLMGLLKELESKHFVTVTTPGLATPNYGNYAVEVTPLALRFAKYILPCVEPD